jgi:RHH-type proline utilization regulon transcriptional repressor/proline dehydrogenase/delta 1-pyrroline-5-carboxylate dehydrogenase
MAIFRRPTRNGANPAAASDDKVETLTLEIGKKLLEDIRANRASMLSSKFWSDTLMDWAMKDPAFKVQLFRFVDVFPMLNTPAMVHDHLVDYLSQPGVKLPPGMDLGLKAGRMAKGLMSKTISNRIGTMAANFIAGVDATSAVPLLRKLWKRGMAFSVDLLGEACLSDAEVEAYQNRYLDLVNTLPGEVSDWPENPTLDTDYLGPIPRANVSIKISSLSARTDPIDFQGSLDALFDGLKPILEAAAKNNVFINFDLEQYSMKDLTLSLFERCCEAIDFPAGLALQAYLHSGEEDAKRIISWSRRSGRQVTVRLIKGAYWDYELISAEQNGWPVPVWTEKRHTDACFERMADLFVSNMPRSTGEGGVKLALGSHNARSIAHTMALLKKNDLPDSAVELQMLHGMADDLKAAAAGQGLRLREYLPVGEMIPGMAYFVRRLLENTSNQSWLRASASDDVDDDQLLTSPHGDPASSEPTVLEPSRHELSRATEGLGDGKPFFNESFRDFSQKDQRDNFAKALAASKIPNVKPVETVEQVDDAIARAAAAFPAWRDAPPMVRSTCLVKAAELMRRRRDELAGVMIREAGKTWREADADICEAIDFYEYYARGAMELFERRRLGKFIGEWNHQWQQPRGVTAVISPWNFPLAICAGMTAAALVTGNTALVKPSTQTRGIAKIMCDIFHKAGVPADVLQFMPGSGRVAGSMLVRDPRVAIIAFTGSKEVGLDILKAAGEVGDRQGFVKKVVCEMGGKNAVIIDDSADLDEAVLGVRHSAFGYCGQKCSACSRVIVLDGVYDDMLRRLVESTRALVIGDPSDPSTDFGPVIDRSAADKILEYVELGKREGKLELACEVPQGLEQKVGMPYVAPHIFSGIKPNDRLAHEEVFGPVLAVMRASSFEEALEIANSTDYKLTGGVFSRKPAHLELARQQFRVGNLYLNRGNTGALVGRQPFGGFGLSGVGTKAGGEDYLLHFVEPRCCTENTMRHGFAPELE